MYGFKCAALFCLSSSLFVFMVLVNWCLAHYTKQARLDILKIHSRKMNLTRGINVRKIAEMMPGASGAEVKVSQYCMSLCVNKHMCIIYQKLNFYTQTQSISLCWFLIHRVCVLRLVCMLYESAGFMWRKKTLSWL